LLTGLDLTDEAPRRQASIPETDLLEILIRFVRERDDTRYGLLNAVTSFARDTHDHEKRWQLEALGGAIATWMGPSPDNCLKLPPDLTSGQINIQRSALAENCPQPAILAKHSAAQPPLHGQLYEQ
jgi:hypothetical protein